MDSGPVGSFLEKLQREGDFDSLGRFTLDASQAREKMRQFQLEDPHFYGIHLVAAAVASGATMIQIHNDADDLRLIFDGRPFTVEDLSQLFSSLFSSERDESLVRLKELAIGVNAAMSFNPRWVDVESQGVHLRVYPHSERLERLRPRHGASLNTSIHVRERAGLRVMLRFVSHLSRSQGPLPESAAIAERCLYSPVPILLNRQSINRPVPVGQGLVLTCIGSVQPPDSWEGIVLREEPTGPWEGYLVLDSRADRTVHWLINGIHFTESLESPGWASVWLVANHLSKDVSQRKVTHNEEWEAVLEALRQVRLRQEQALARGYAELPESLQPLARTLLLDLMSAHIRVGTPWDPKYNDLVECPLFLLAEGGYVSLGALLAQARERQVELCWVTDKAWELPPLDATLVIHVDSATNYCLSEVFRTVPSGDYLLLGALRAAVNKKRFEALLPEYPRFDDSEEVLLSLPLEGEGFHGQLALCGLRSWPNLVKPRMTVFQAGRLLGERPLPEGALPDGVSVLVNAAEVAANADWSGIQPGQALFIAVDLAVEARLDELLQAAADRLEGDEKRRLLKDAVIAYLAHRRAAGQEPGPLADVPILGACSYAQLLKQQQRLGFTPVTDRRWVAEEDRVVTIPAHSPLELEETVVICQDAWLKPRLEKLFPSRRSYDRELGVVDKFRRSQQRWLEQPQVPCRLPEGQAYLVRLALTGCEGEVALPAAFPTSAIPVHFFREGRPLGTRFFNYESRAQGGLPEGLHAAIRQDDFQPHPDWSMVEAGPTLNQAMGILREHIDPLYATLGDGFPRHGPARRWAQAALASYLEWRGPGCDGIPASLLSAPSLDGLGEGRHSLRELLDEVERWGRARVLINETQLEGGDEPDGPFFRLSADLFRALESWLGLGVLVDAQEDYLLALCAREFERRPPEEAVLAGQVVGRISLSSCPGELGLVCRPELSPQHLKVRVLHGGRWLADWELTLGAGGAPPLLQTPASSLGRWRAMAVVEAGGLPARADWSDLAENKSRRALEKSLRLAARGLGLALLEEKDNPDALAYLWNQLSYEFAEGTASRMDALRQELLEAPLFPTATGQWCSLGRLHQEIEEHGRVGYLLTRPDPPPEKEPIVVVRRELLPLFRSIVGVEHTADAGRAVKARLRAVRAEPVERLELPDREYLAVGLLGSSREGRVGLCLELGHGSRVQLFSGLRPLDERRLSWPFVVEAVVDDASLRPNPDWTGAGDGPELEAALRAVKEVAVQLVMGLVHGWAGDPDNQRPTVRRYLVGLACRVKGSGLELGLQKILQELPLFLSSTRERVSLRDMTAADRVLSLPPNPDCEGRALGDLLPDNALTLLLEVWEAEEVKRAVPLVDYRESLAVALFLAGLPESETPRLPDDCLADWDLTSPLQGRVGWRRASQELELALMWRGRLIKRHLSGGFPGGFAVIHHNEVDFTEPVLERLAAGVRQQMRAFIQRQLDRVDWLPVAETRKLWIELAEQLQLGKEPRDALELQLLTRRRFQSVGGAPRSLEELREHRPPWALPGESVPLRVPPVLCNSLEEAELLQRVVGPLPRAGKVVADLREWMVEIDLQLPGFEGRLAVAREDPLAEGVDLKEPGVRIELTPGVVGWVDGPLAGPEQAQRLLARPLLELMLRLVRELPAPLERVLQVAARFLPWRQRSALPAELCSAPLFGLRNGQRLSLNDLLDQDALYFAPPHDLEAPPEAVVLDGSALAWLCALRPGREPRPWNKREDDRPEAQPARLLEELQALGVGVGFLELRDDLDAAIPGYYLDGVAIIHVNRLHPLWQKLLKDPRGPARYYLLSALASQSSMREQAREIHRRLLGLTSQVEEL